MLILSLAVAEHAHSIHRSSCGSASSTCGFKERLCVVKLRILYMPDSLARNQNPSSKVFLFDSLKILFNSFLKFGVAVKKSQVGLIFFFLFLPGPLPSSCLEYRRDTQ